MAVRSFLRSQLSERKKYTSMLAGNDFTPPVPSFLSSAPLWLDAADSSTITESGGSVSQWDNKGTLSNFVQATSADQPTTGVTTQNGLNVIDFNSSLMQHNGTLGEYKFLHDGTAFFMAGVFSHTSDGNINRIITSQAKSSINVGFTFTMDDRGGGAGTDKTLITIGNGSSRPALIEDVGFFPSAFNIQSSIYDLTASVSDRVDYFRNDTQGGVTNSDSGAVTSSNPAEKLTIGSDSDGTNAFVGSLAELIIVSGTDATETNRQEVVTYLNVKWSVF